jgi:hypothetical protein
VVAFLALLGEGSARRLALFYLALFLALMTMATSVNTLAACVLFLILLPRVRGWDDELPAITREGPRRLFLGNLTRAGLTALFLSALAGVAVFSWIHFQDLAASSSLYQGTYVKSLRKTTTGEVKPLASLAVVYDETASTLGPEFAVLGLAAAANMLRRRRLSHVSLIFGLSFLAAMAECLFVVPTAQLTFSWRAIAYTFPLLVVVADNAGDLLSRWRGGPALLVACVVLALVHQGFRPVADLSSVLAPGTAAGPYKALGYVYRSNGLDETARGCTVLDVPLDGSRSFYLNGVKDRLLEVPGAPFDVCVAVLSKPPSGRMERAMRISRLRHRRSIADGGREELAIYLNDDMAARWREPAVLDVKEYSRRFSQEFNTIDRLFGPRWAVAPTASSNRGFY